MSNKTKVLEILEKNRHKSISGEDLASKLNISRNAIHKIIKDLRTSGYTINAVTGKGYQIANDTDIISLEGIKSFIKNSSLSNIHIYSSLESTNQTAKKIALAEESGTSLVIANEQTKGRGRLGKNFYSPPDSGIYMSFILRPNTTIENSIFITTLASVLICRSIKKTLNLEPKIKWINDIILNGKKVCGILTEAITDFETGNVDYIILGIGINYSTEIFPEEIKDIAGSFISKSETQISRNQLIGAIIEEFENYSIELFQKNYIDEYRQYSFVIGKKIQIIMPTQTKDAEVLDIDTNGGLLVLYQDGSTQILNTGEIKMKGDFFND